jgi:hypothetical protein
VHALEGEFFNALREGGRADRGVKCFSFFVGVRLERRVRRPDVKAFEDVDLPMRVTSAGALKADSGAIPVF